MVRVNTIQAVLRGGFGTMALGLCGCGPSLSNHALHANMTIPGL